MKSKWVLFGFIYLLGSSLYAVSGPSDLGAGSEGDPLQLNEEAGSYSHNLIYPISRHLPSQPNTVGPCGDGQGYPSSVSNVFSGSTSIRFDDKLHVIYHSDESSSYDIYLSLDNFYSSSILVGQEVDVNHWQDETGYSGIEFEGSEYSEYLADSCDGCTSLFLTLQVVETRENGDQVYSCADLMVSHLSDDGAPLCYDHETEEYYECDGGLGGTKTGNGIGNENFSGTEIQAPVSQASPEFAAGGCAQTPNPRANALWLVLLLVSLLAFSRKAFRYFG